MNVAELLEQRRDDIKTVCASGGRKEFQKIADIVERLMDEKQREQGD